MCSLSQVSMTSMNLCRKSFIQIHVLATSKPRASKPWAVDSPAHVCVHRESFTKVYFSVKYNNTDKIVDSRRVVSLTPTPAALAAELVTAAITLPNGDLYTWISDVEALGQSHPPPFSPLVQYIDLLLLDIGLWKFTRVYHTYLFISQLLENRPNIKVCFFLHTYSLPVPELKYTVIEINNFAKNISHELIPVFVHSYSPISTQKNMKLIYLNFCII